MEKLFPPVVWTGHGVRGYRFTVSGSRALLATSTMEDRPAAAPPAWDDNADEVVVEGMVTAVVALLVLALVRMLTSYLWSRADAALGRRRKMAALPPLPPLAEQPWFKKEPGWYIDRWKLVAHSRRTSRPIRFVVLAPGAAATEADVLHLTLVRHGQGIHNVLADEALARGDTRPPYSAARLAELPHMVDAALTERGRAEARANQPKARALAPQPCLLVGSPLQRAMETGLLTFAHAVEEAAAPISVLACDGCREGHFTRNICDLRRPLSEVRAQFEPSGVDFSHVVPTKADAAGEPVDIPGETVDTIVDRGYAFLLWLLAWSEAHAAAHAAAHGGADGAGGGMAAVAVATHSVFLLSLTSGVLEWSDEADPRRDYFETGEMRTLTVRVERARE